MEDWIVSSWLFSPLPFGERGWGRGVRRVVCKSARPPLTPRSLSLTSTLSPEGRGKLGRERI